LEEVGKIFNVTRERVRQIESKAVRKLQNPYHSQHLVEFLNGPRPSTDLHGTPLKKTKKRKEFEQDEDSDDESAA
jgi:hypothetical protein